MSMRLPWPRWTFPHVEWFPGLCETFSFSPCRVVTAKASVEALIYHPHPETKPAHFQYPSIVEVLAPYLEALDRESTLFLEVRSQEISIQSPGLSR